MPISVRTFADAGEAARALQASRTARYLGGGTIVMRAVNAGDQSFDTIIRVSDPRLRQITAQGDTITIGAGVTMAQVMGSRDLAFLAPVARGVGGPAVRNMASVGGNLFAASPYGDFAAALLALDSKILTTSGQPAGIEEFLAARERDGGRAIVTAIIVPRPREAGSFRFLKASRVKPKGISLLSISALLPTQGGRVSRARVAYAAMGERPVRALAVERALEGAALDEGGIAAALRAATEGLQPLTDAIASEWYRRQIAPVHLKRLLLRR
ncbi:MAG: oxidoreductase [Mesorhizobium amorphae]|nr:MAG: oxidoreductase [Mesorhizobium amorphae]